jgi:RND family efflux transporter MFP subunit
LHVCSARDILRVRALPPLSAIEGESIHMSDEDLSKLRIDKTAMAVRRRRGRRYVLLVLLLVGLLALGVGYQKGMLTPAVEVQVAGVQNVYPSQAFSLLNASGYVVAQRKAAVASKLTGRLVFLAVEEGDQVKKDQVIARLENGDALATRDQAEANVKVARFRLEQAKAELEDAELAFNRKKELVARGYIARSEFDNAEAAYKSSKAAVAAQQASLWAAEAGLKEAEVLLDYTNIRVPFDGVVLTKNADIGDIVTPIGAAANAKAAVVTIADMDSLMVEVDVSESNIGQVTLGQPCEIQLDALPDYRFRGQVHMIVPTADRTKASVMVKVAFRDRDPRILPEMSAKVAFLSREVAPSEERPMRTVPSSAVLERDGRHVVFVDKGDAAVKTLVRVGRQLDDMTEILEGLEIGETVVVAPLNKIKDGTKIKTPKQ